MKTFTMFVVSVALFGLPIVSSDASQTNRVGSAAPAPVLINLDGQYEYLSHLYYEGAEQPRRPRSVVVLNFMGLKCAPCRKELPLFLQVLRSAMKYGEKSGQPVRFYLVSTDPLSAKDDLRKFLSQQKVDPETEALLDPYGKTAEKFGVTGIPRTFVISPQGRITADIAGAVDDYKKLLQNGIRIALKEKTAQ